jgi:ABC-type glycerol-3-phosphate transport system substrate-binding protein
VRRLALLLTALALAGCGGSSTQTTTTNAAAPPGPGTTLYAGGDWAVVLDGDQATAFQKVGGAWTADTSGAVKVAILGPHPGETVAAIPQFAAELSATKPLIESGMWVDGKELPVKGGGLTSTKGTIYGALGTPLTKGKHVAVAYARTAEHATAVAWSFSVA